MATLTIRDIPEDLLQKLERSARRNERAVDAEAVVWLSREGGLGSDTRELNEPPDPWLQIARQTRKSMPNVRIDDNEELNRFKREG